MDINEALGQIGVSYEDWDSIVKACVVDNTTQAQYEEQRKQIVNSNSLEVNREVAEATKFSDSTSDDSSYIRTSSGNVLPDIQSLNNKPSDDEVKAGYCYTSIKPPSKIISFPSRNIQPVSKDDVIFQQVDNGVQDLVTDTLNNLKDEPVKQKAILQMNNVNRAYRDKDVNTARTEAMQNSNKCNKQAESKVLYCQDSFTSCGEDVKFTSAVIPVDWDSYFCGDVEKDLDALRSQVSRFISRNCGGFKNIRRIVVRDHRLIINNKSCFIPKLSKECLLNLPLDAQSYMTAGALAPFFDWHYISKMPNLGVVDFDSADFVLDWVLPDLGWGGAEGVDIYKCFFYNSDSLREVIISDESVSRSNLNNLIKEEQETGTVESTPIVERVSRKAKWKKVYRDTVSNDNSDFWNKAFAGKAPNIIGTADAWREWQWGTVKNFATNRGDKGFFRYAFGTVGRVGLALAVTPLTFAPRLIKGVGSMLKGVFKEATTAISDEEMYDDGKVE